MSFIGRTQAHASKWHGLRELGSHPRAPVGSARDGSSGGAHSGECQNRLSHMMEAWRSIAALVQPVMASVTWQELHWMKARGGGYLCKRASPQNFANLDVMVLQVHFVMRCWAVRMEGFCTHSDTVSDWTARNGWLHCLPTKLQETATCGGTNGGRLHCLSSKR